MRPCHGAAWLAEGGVADLFPQMAQSRIKPGGMERGVQVERLSIMMVAELMQEGVQKSRWTDHVSSCGGSVDDPDSTEWLAATSHTRVGGGW